MGKAYSTCSTTTLGIVIYILMHFPVCVYGLLKQPSPSCLGVCSVLYFSVHRYERGKFWPNLRESDFDHVGLDRGRGFNVNVPLNEVLKHATLPHYASPI